jgi:predicted RNase H-like HicB family nuclease
MKPLLIWRQKCMHYKAVIEPGNESGYVAYIPALKGCVSQGATRDEAFINLKEAAEGYLECLIEDNLPIPPEVEVEDIELEVA